MCKCANLMTARFCIESITERGGVRKDESRALCGNNKIDFILFCKTERMRVLYKSRCSS
jgi:hypothetical protein